MAKKRCIKVEAIPEGSIPSSKMAGSSNVSINGTGSTAFGYKSEALDDYAFASGGSNKTLYTWSVKIMTSYLSSSPGYAYVFDHTDLPDEFEDNKTYYNKFIDRTITTLCKDVNGEYKTATIMGFDFNDPSAGHVVFLNNPLVPEEINDFNNYGSGSSGAGSSGDSDSGDNGTDIIEDTILIDKHFTFSYYENADNKSIASGVGAHSENTGKAYGFLSHAEGDSLAHGPYSHTEGGSSAYGSYSHAEGASSVTMPTAMYSHVEGLLNTTYASAAHAEGFRTEALGDYSHTEGEYSHAAGNYSHAEGVAAIAFGKGSHAEGYSYHKLQVNGTNGLSNTDPVEYRKFWENKRNSSPDKVFTMALGEYSHAEGNQNLACGDYSHAEGTMTEAIGKHSHTSGYQTIANNDCEFACGKFNNSINGQTLFSVGCGESSTNRKNAIEVKNDGHVYLFDEQAIVKSDLPLAKGAGGNSIVQNGGTCGASAVNSCAFGKSTRATKSQAFAEGSDTTASGYQSHAEGENTIASGQSSHAEGGFTIASGNYSHAEGQNTVAAEPNCHSEGNSTISRNNSHAEGQNTIAIGWQSHAEGKGTKNSLKNIDISVYNDCISTNTSSAHETKVKNDIEKMFNDQRDASADLTPLAATGAYSHAEGYATLASNAGAHAEGHLTWASGAYSHAEGESTTASGQSSHAEGHLSTAQGDYSHAEGDDTWAEGDCCHAEGRLSWTFYHDSSLYVGKEVKDYPGKYAHAEGYNTRAGGNYSHAEGNSTIAVNCSHAEGEKTIAVGWQSHAEGQGTKASGYRSHAEGQNTVASGNQSHAEGQDTGAIGLGSHAEGCHTTANGQYSHTEGYYTVADSSYSHAGGEYSTATGQSSFAHGYHVSTKNNYEVAFGKCNISTTGKTLFTVGYGDNLNPSYPILKNAIEVDIDGSVYINTHNNYVLPDNKSNHEVATRGYVNEKIADLINSAPETLDTLGELATALKNDASIIVKLQNDITTLKSENAQLRVLVTNLQQAVDAISKTE